MKTMPGEAGSQPLLRGVVGEGIARRALLTALIAANTTLVPITLWGFFVSDAGYDWLIYVEAGRRAFDDTLYAWNEVYAWSYSPLLAYVFAAIGPIGYAGWSLAHAAAVFALRDRRLVVLTLLSWPFWADVYNGNTMTFVFVAAALALCGSTAGTAAYFGLFLLMPRPLTVPLVIWLLWRRPPWRWPFVGMAAANAVLVLATGHAGEWFSTLTSVSDAVAATARDIGPANLLGPAWAPIGGALAGYFVWRNRLGLASIAASPYWLPQYLIMVLLEIMPSGRLMAFVRPRGAQER